MSRGGGHARLFVALEIPHEVRTRLTAWARAARRPGGELRVLDEELLHVTLCFLGSRPVDEIDALRAVVGGCAAPVGELSLHAPLWLPPRRPRVLAVEVANDGDGLTDLHRDLVRAIAAAIEWESEQRQLRAHVTVARMRGGAAPRGRELPPTPALAFAAEAVTLLRSHLAPDGATYEAIERVPIAE